MDWIKKGLGLGAKDEHHTDQSGGRGLTDTSRYESTADKMGVIPSQKLQEERAAHPGRDEPVDQSGGRGLFETSRYETTADKMGAIPSEQLLEQRGLSSVGAGQGASTTTGSSDTYEQPIAEQPQPLASTGTGVSSGMTGTTDSYTNTDTTTTGSSTGLTGSGSASSTEYIPRSEAEYATSASNVPTTYAGTEMHNVIAVDPLLRTEDAESVAARVLGAPTTDGGSGSGSGVGESSSGGI